MKRRFEEMSSHHPGTVEQVRQWLRRVELFQQVNWDVELPSVGAIMHLLDDDFVWDWSPTCTRQYDAVAELTGVVHVEGVCRAPRPIDPPPHSDGKPLSPGTVGRPPPVLPTSPDTDDESDSAPHVCDSDCSDGCCEMSGGV